MNFFRRKLKSNPKVKNATPTTGCAYGFSHRSKLEAAVCQIVFLREKAGEIVHLQHEDHIYLTDARIGYVADFKVQDSITGEVFWIESKGFANDTWPIKKRLYKTYGPGKLEIWTGYHTRPVLTETIVPKKPKTSGEVEDGLR